MPTPIHRLALVVTVIAVAFAHASQAQAEAVELGGRSAATINVNAIHNDLSDLTVIASGTVTKITQSGHFEFGGGLTYVGIGIGGDTTAAVLIPTFNFRLNSAPLGAEKNIIAYAGAQAGVAIQDSSVQTELEYAFSGGPKLGVEYYFTPNVAIQGEWSLILQEDPFVAGDILYTNSGLIGLRLLF